MRFLARRARADHPRSPRWFLLGTRTRTGLRLAGTVRLCGDGRTTLVTLSGDDDASAAAPLRTLLDNSCSQTKRFIVDLSQLTFLDPSVMDVLVDILSCAPRSHQRFRR
jgi:ABC-type transporter Mla MlaB component